MASAISLTASLNLDPSSVTGSAKQIQQALGRITGQASEFQKSLDASTARVFAFGATTSVINGITQSFKTLAATTINVQARLTEINTILGASSAEFNKFRESIFNVAKNTGQSFNTVAEGAAELARQGLGATESAKRLEAALILTRISGIDAAASVKALTAAMNGFTSAGLSAEQIVNKIVAVDTAFAVSAQDLAEGFSRAGSTAEDAGVSFDELLGLITTVEQKTARGGATIGNAFKSIFTRLSRGTTIDDLKALGVEIDASQSGVQKLQALASALERTSDPTISNQIKELAGGVYQINVVSAALKDLSSESSIFANATATAMQASNNAYARNAELNKTIAAQLNELTASLTSFAERVGSVTFAPLLENLIGIATKLSDFLDQALDPEKGNKFIKGLFSVIGNFLSGPGLALFTAAFLKISTLVAKFAVEGFKSLMQVNTASERIKNIEEGIVNLLGKDANLRSILANKALSQAQKQQAIINAIKQENQLLQQQQQILTNIATVAAKAGVRGYQQTTGFSGRRGRTFASGFQQEEATAMMLGASSGVKAHYGQGTIGGKRFIMNNQEIEIPNFGANGDSAVIPMYARGYAGGTLGSAKNPIQTKRFSYLIPEVKAGAKELLTGTQAYSLSKGAKPTYFQSGATVHGLQPDKVKTISDKDEDSLHKKISSMMFNTAASWSSNLSPLGTTIDSKRVEMGFNSIAGAKGALNGAIGSAFEVAITKSLGYKASQREGGDFDFRAGRNASKIQELFGITNTIGDFKNSVSDGNKKSFLTKIHKESGAPVFGDKQAQALARKRAEKDANKRKFPSSLQGRKQRDAFLNSRMNRHLALIRGGRAAGHIPRFASGSMPSPLSAKFFQILNDQLRLSKISALEYAKAVKEAGLQSGLSAKQAKGLAMQQLRAQKANPVSKVGARLRQPVGAGPMGGIALSMGLTAGLTLLEKQSMKFEEAGRDGAKALTDAASSTASLASAGAALGGPMGAAAGALIGIGKSLWDAYAATREAKENLNKITVSTGAKQQRISSYGDIAYSAMGVERSKETSIAKMKLNYKKVMAASGQQDTLTPLIDKNEKIIKSSTATAEEKQQAEKALTEAFKKIGDIYRSGDQITALKRSVATYSEYLKQAGDKHKQIADSFGQKLETYGMSIGATSTMLSAVEGPMKASLQARTSTNQDILATSQARQKVLGLQTQLATTTDPEARKEIQENIIEASKEFRKQVVDAATNMATRQIELANRLKEIEIEKQQENTRLMSDAISNIASIYQNRGQIDLNVVSELGDAFKAAQNPEERARILTQLQESTLKNVPEELRQQILDMFGASKEEIQAIEKNIMFTGGTEAQRNQLYQTYQTEQEKGSKTLNQEETALKSELNALQSKMKEFGKAFDAKPVLDNLDAMAKTLKDAGTNMTSFTNAAKNLDQVGTNLLNLTTSTNEALKASEANMKELQRQIANQQEQINKLVNNS